MIYKCDPSKKKKFILRYSAEMAFFYVMFLLFCIFVIKSFQAAPVICGIVLAAINGIFILKAYKNYDKGEVELTDTEIIIRRNKYEKAYPLDKIEKVIRDSSFIDPDRLLISFGKWKAVVVNSYVENYEDICQKICAIKKPEEKKAVGIKYVFRFCLYIFLFMPLFALELKIIPVILVSDALGIFSAVFIIFAYMKGTQNKTKKITGSVTYIFIALMYLFCFVSFIFIYFGSDFRVNYNGDKVLMRRVSETKYDKDGNVVYYKICSTGQKIYYNKFSKDETDNTEEDYDYEEDSVTSEVVSSEYSEDYSEEDSESKTDSTSHNPDIIYNDHNNIIYINYNGQITEYSYDYNKDGKVIRVFSKVH